MSLRDASFCIITLVILNISCVVGLRCYSCSSIYNDRCTEPFDLYPVNMNYIESNCTTCAKMHVSREYNCDEDNECDVEHAIYRSCLRVKIERDHCHYGNFMHIYGKECFCQRNLCNTGSKTRDRHIVSNVFMLFALFSYYKYM